MINSQLVYRSEYRWDLKKVDSVIIPYLFDNDANLIISLEAKPLKNYKSSGRIEQILIDYPNKLVASSQILRFGNQELTFAQRGRFQLVFFPNAYLGKTKITIHKMFFPLRKQQTTQAQPTADINVSSTAKSVIISEKSDASRYSYLISNTGSSSVYFKYVPIGTNSNDVTVSATNYDFVLSANEKFLDSNASQNAIVGICSGLLSTAKVKVTEYLYI